jgi:hypothetical protein
LCTGSQTITGSYGGDSRHAASSGQDTVLVYAFPPGRGFVIGDQRRVAGVRHQLDYWRRQQRIASERAAALVHGSDRREFDHELRLHHLW